MEEIKGKNTEELLESLNSLLDKMPGLLKQAEELQISRRELEKEKEDAAKKTAGMMNLPVGNSSDFAQTSDYNEYQIPEIRQESDTASRIKENDEHKASETAAAGPDEKTDPVFRKAPASMPQDHRRRVVFLYSESSELLLEKFLNDMDSLSLASEKNPFFVSRASVRKADAGGSGDISKPTFQADISGLVYLGSVPEDEERKLADLCLQERIAFFHCDEMSYSKDNILDFLIELIAIEKVNL